MFRVLLTQVIQASIWIYQKTISFDHGVMRLFTGGQRRCKFYPTCSEYAQGALNKHGLIKGSVLTLNRIVRCNPWSQGGVDEP